MITVLYIVLANNDVILGLFAVFVFGQIIANWIILFKAGNVDYGAEVEGGDVSNYRYCDKCRIYKHNLTHHCSLCGWCILRHDHHCFFLGSCIGLENQHNFLVFCLYTGIGSFYLCLEVFWSSHLSYENWYNYLELFMPFGFVVSLLTKAKSLFNVYMILFFNASITVAMFCTFMTSLQVYLLSLNLTWHEFSNKLDSRTIDWRLAWKNFKYGFGKYGILSLIFPVFHARGKHRLHYILI